MLIKNVHIENDRELSDIRIKKDRFAEIAKGLVPKPGEEVIEGGAHLVLPPFIESHVHLDTCFTAGEPRWNMSGTLFEGIECWAQRKEQLTKEDIKKRAGKAIQMLALNGIQYVRTHVDVTDPRLTAAEAMLELKEELKELMTIQIVAFPQEGIFSYPNGKELLKKAVEMGIDCVGAIPHFEFTREYSVESLNFAMELAARYDKLVDVHCDEIDDEASRGLETVACRALELGLYDKVTASHTTAMHSYNNAYVNRLMRLLKMSRINFIANPLINTHLQGRTDTYPKRRGVTRVKELLEEGINVSFGNDDIFDPWYPMGTGNMRDTLFLGLHVCQMMGYREILDSYQLITYNASKTLHLGEDYGIKTGNTANFILMDAADFYQALNEKSTVLYSFRKGKMISKATPEIKKLLY